MTASPPTTKNAIGTQQPSARPILRCRPALVIGTPSLRDTLPFAADKPLVRFQENEVPNFRRLAIALSVGIAHCRAKSTADMQNNAGND